jgi:hypothetical protein
MVKKTTTAKTKSVLVLFFVINEKNDSKNHIKQIGQWMMILKSVPVFENSVRLSMFCKFMD